jgi:hypothetical protein
MLIDRLIGPRGAEADAATDEAAAGIQDWGPGELYPHPEGPATPERHPCMLHAGCSDAPQQLGHTQTQDAANQLLQ